MHPTIAGYTAIHTHHVYHGVHSRADPPTVRFLRPGIIFILSRKVIVWFGPPGSAPSSMNALVIKFISYRRSLVTHRTQTTTTIGYRRTYYLGLCRRRAQRSCRFFPKPREIMNILGNRFYFNALDEFLASSETSRCCIVRVRIYLRINYSL